MFYNRLNDALHPGRVRRRCADGERVAPDRFICRELFPSIISFRKADRPVAFRDTVGRVVKNYDPRRFSARILLAETFIRYPADETPAEARGNSKMSGRTFFSVFGRVPEFFRITESRLGIK